MAVAQGRSRPAALPALTGIRALLAWLVVGFHFSGIAPFGHGTADEHPPFGNGPFAVDCFFILSGFILFHVHSELGRSPDRREIGRFLRYRFARLYPVHLVMLLLFVASVWGLWLLTGVQPNEPSRFSGAALLDHLFLLHGWGFTGLLSWNYPSWTISSEWAAYLVAPLLFALAVRLPDQAIMPVAALIGLTTAIWLNGGNPSLNLSIPRVMLGFSFGVLLCRLRDIQNHRLLQIRRFMLALLWPLFLLTLLLPQGGLIAIAFAVLMLFHGVEVPRRSPSASGSARLFTMIRTRSGRLIVYLGETSYAVYMSHAFVEACWLTLSVKLHLFNKLSPVAVALMIALLVQASAMALHHMVEEPGRRLLRRW